MYGEGISREGDLLDLAVNNNIVEKSGSWFSYKSDRIGQGRENARAFLKENKDIYAKIEGELKKALGIGKPEPAPAPASAPEMAQAKSVAGKK
jgi:recombination protein RecA